MSEQNRVVTLSLQLPWKFTRLLTWSSLWARSSVNLGKHGDGILKLGQQADLYCGLGSRGLAGKMVGEWVALYFLLLNETLLQYQLLSLPPTLRKRSEQNSSVEWTECPPLIWAVGHGGEGSNLFTQQEVKTSQIQIRVWAGSSSPSQLMMKRRYVCKVLNMGLYLESHCSNLN